MLTITNGIYIFLCCCLLLIVGVSHYFEMKMRHYDGNSRCHFVKTLDIVTKYLTDGLPTVENLIINTDIMKIGQAFTKL